LDTREKIIDLDRAAAIAAGWRGGEVKWKLVAGYFDVLTPARVRELRQASNGGPLVAVVLDPPDPLLPSRARAELAASLRVVDYVLLSNGVEELVKQLRPDEVIHAQADDQKRSRELVDHVHRRNRA
jgi:glycerol-3-phosphate cytidylyltransferase-like family protein